MMNLLALGLVLTSLVTAGFFTPNPENQKVKEEVILKEGHRVVVVEYEKDDGNTKVSISPHDSQALHENGYVTKVFDKMAERIEDVKEGASSVVGRVEEEIHPRFNARELVCDAYGKCKHKIATALEKIYEVEEEAKEAMSEAIGKVKDTAYKASDKVQEAKENVDNVSEKANELKDEASRKMEGAKDKVSEKAKEAEKWVENASHRVKKEGKKELSEILHHAREVAVDVFEYVAPPERVASFTGVLHLMGFSAAYGMCVWVTFGSSHVLAGALPRQQFAMVQSKIYPVYFKAMAYSVGMALLGHLMGPRIRLGRTSVGALQGVELMSSLVMILVNLMCLEPRATKVMLERMKKEKEEGKGKESNATGSSGRSVDSTADTVGRGTPVTQGASRDEAAAKSHQIIPLSQALQRLNSYSSFLNVLTLVSLTWHLVHLGQRLHTVC